uniref:Uncharacterized protein n=1 Tax=Aegilops tauschii subsp. strangulata TaxID=200361 RepID=A0A453T555_AEGTS
MDLEAVPVRKACTEMLKRATRQQRYRLKKEYFDPHAPHLVRRTSPVPSMTDDQWNELVESWKDPKKMVLGYLKLTKLIELKLSSTKLLERAATLCTVEIWETNTRIKNQLQWICSRSATTARKRNVTPMLCWM